MLLAGGRPWIRRTAVTRSGRFTPKVRSYLPAVSLSGMYRNVKGGGQPLPTRTRLAPAGLRPRRTADGDQAVREDRLVIQAEGQQRPLRQPRQYLIHRHRGHDGPWPAQDARLPGVIQQVPADPAADRTAMNSITPVHTLARSPARTGSRDSSTASATRADTAAPAPGPGTHRPAGRAAAPGTCRTARTDAGAPFTLGYPPIALRKAFSCVIPSLISWRPVGREAAYVFCTAPSCTVCVPCAKYAMAVLN